MIWAVYGLLHSALRAAFTETSRVLQVDAWKLAFWQSLCGLILFVPFTPFMAWPGDDRFYIAAAGVALIITVGMLIQLTLSSQKTGRVSSIYMPLETLAAFGIWLILTPSLLEGYMDEPAKLAGLAAAFLISAAALLKIRPNDASLQTFAIVVPVGLTYAVAGVVTKVVMPAYDILPLAMSYAMVNFAVMTLVMGLVVLLKKGKEDVGTRRMIRAGFIAGLFSAAGYVFFVASVTAAPNPGYVSMMAMLLPVWLMGWRRIRRAEDSANPAAAAAIIAGILLLLAVAA